MISYRSLVLHFERIPDENLITILGRLPVGGYLQNIRKLGLSGLHRPQLVEVICSMKNLKKLVSECSLTLEDFSHVFQSCSKLIELDFWPACQLFEMDLKNYLRPGFQKLRRLDLGYLHSKISWPVIQEMCTLVR